MSVCVGDKSDGLSVLKYNYNGVTQDRFYYNNKIYRNSEICEKLLATIYLKDLTKVSYSNADSNSNSHSCSYRCKLKGRQCRRRSRCPVCYAGSDLSAEHGSAAQFSKLYNKRHKDYDMINKIKIVGLFVSSVSIVTNNVKLVALVISYNVTIVINFFRSCIMTVIKICDTIYNTEYKVWHVVHFYSISRVKIVSIVKSNIKIIVKLGVSIVLIVRDYRKASHKDYCRDHCKASRISCISRKSHKTSRKVSRSRKSRKSPHKKAGPTTSLSH